MKDWRLSHKKFQPGFTLIEVLVALAIVAITVAAGMQAAGSMINNAERFAQINEAQWCADNHLTGLPLWVTLTFIANNWAPHMVEKCS